MKKRFLQHTILLTIELNKANRTARSRGEFNHQERRFLNYKIAQNGMFRIVKGLKTDSKEVECGRCMRGSDGKLFFGENERGNVWKDYMERIMNEENYWECNVEGDAVEGPVVCVSREEVLQALNKNMKSPRTFRSITGVDCC